VRQPQEKIKTKGQPAHPAHLRVQFFSRSTHRLKA
jgi:hypothetical protein